MTRAQGQQMLLTDKHLIERAEIDISFPNQYLADEFQSQAQGFMLHDLLPIIDEVFEQYSENGWVLSIDKLVLDLGKLPAHDYRSQLLLKVEQALAEQLRLLSNPANPASSKSNLDVSHPLGSGFFQRNGQADTDQDMSHWDYHRLPKTQANWLQLKYFLERGVLSWNADASGFYARPKSWTTWFETTVFTHLGPLTHLLHTAGNKQEIITRLLRHLTTDKAIACLNTLTQGERQMALLLKIMLDYGDGQGFSQTQQQFFTQGGWLAGRNKAEVQGFLLALFLSVISKSVISKSGFNKSGGATPEMTWANSDANAGANIGANGQGFSDLRLGWSTSWFNVCQQYAPRAMKAEFNAMFSSGGATDNQYPSDPMTTGVEKPSLASPYGRQRIMELFTWALLQGKRSGLLFIWSLATHECAKEFVLLLRYLGQQYGIRHALATELSEPMFIDSLTLLEPSESAFILSFRHLFNPLAQMPLLTATNEEPHKSERLAGSKNSVDSSSAPHSGATLPAMANSHRLFWAFTLNYLLVDRGSCFNRKSYLGSMIKQVASHQNVSQARLHQSLCQSLICLQTDSPLVRNMHQVLSELSLGVKDASAVKEQRIRTKKMKHKQGLTEEEIMMTRLCMALQQGRIELIAKHWSSYIGEHGELLRRGLYLYGQQLRVIQMLVISLSEPMLQALLGVLAPSEKAFIVSLMAQLTGLIVELEAGPKLEATRVKQYLWQFSLGYLVTERGSVFNKLSYLGSVTQQMAAHHNLDHQLLVSGLIQGLSVPGNTSVMRSELMELLVSLLIQPIDLDQNLLSWDHMSSAAQSSDKSVSQDKTDQAQITEGKNGLSQEITETAAEKDEFALDEVQLLRRLVLALELSDAAILETLLTKANKAVLAKFTLILLHYGRSDIQIRRYLLVLPKSTQYRLVALLAPRLLLALPALIAHASLLLTGIARESFSGQAGSPAQALLLMAQGSEQDWLSGFSKSGSSKSEFSKKVSRYALSQALEFSVSLEAQLGLFLWHFICCEAFQPQGIAPDKALKKGADLAALVRYLIKQMASYRHVSYQTLLQAMVNEATRRSNASPANKIAQGGKSSPPWLVELLRQCLAIVPSSASSLTQAFSAKDVHNSYAQTGSAQQALGAIDKVVAAPSPLNSLMLFQLGEQRLLTMAASLKAARQVETRHRESRQSAIALVNSLIFLSNKDIARCLFLMQQALMQSLDWHFIYANTPMAQRQPLRQLLEAANLSPSLGLSWPALGFASSSPSDMSRWYGGIKSLATNKLRLNSLSINDLSDKVLSGSPITGLAGSSKVNKLAGKAALQAELIDKSAQIVVKEPEHARERIEQDQALDDKDRSAGALKALQMLLKDLAKAGVAEVDYLVFAKEQARACHRLDVCLTYLLKHDAAALKACLLASIGQQDQLMLCLISIRSDSELTELMTFLYGCGFSQLHTGLTSLLLSCPTLSQISSGSNWRVWLFIAKTLAQGGRDPEPAVMDFLQTLYLTDKRFKDVFSSCEHFLTQLRGELKGKVMHGGIQAKIAIPQLKLFDKAMNKSAYSPSTQEAQIQEVRGEGVSFGAERNDRNDNANDKEQETQSMEKIYLANAGLVLLGPYISRLFTMLSLTHQGKFIDDNTQEKALHVLQYLVNGQQDSPEFQLSLNKILCGMNTARPLKYHPELTSEDKAMAEGLLAGVIQNWPSLGNTSLDGLRQTFLQREGVITLEKEAWKLRIKPTAFDVLLDSLPWSFGVIKFPWMERVLHVEWR
ncbi:contractile injection system tape measure protein [Shewanella frigidimarina]|uniref:contractile injection system tape measure protein n=1 Tax=Shewanella frigidimarina TaxID=56812 RepID=UPI003D7BB731